MQLLSQNVQLQLEPVLAPAEDAPDRVRRVEAGPAAQEATGGGDSGDCVSGRSCCQLNGRRRRRRVATVQSGPDTDDGRRITASPCAAIVAASSATAIGTAGSRWVYVGGHVIKNDDLQ